MRQIEVGATLENIQVVTEFIDEILDEYECPVKARMQIDVAIDEIFTNIASYAYPGRDEPGMASVTVDVSEDAKNCRISFADSGIPFNPLEAPAPDTTLTVDEREIGGLGIFIVRKTMDSVDYRYEDGRNIFTISKTLQ